MRCSTHIIDSLTRGIMDPQLHDNCDNQWLELFKQVNKIGARQAIPGWSTRCSRNSSTTKSIWMK